MEADDGKTHNAKHFHKEVECQQGVFRGLEDTTCRVWVRRSKGLLRELAEVYPFEESEVAACCAILSSRQPKVSSRYTLVVQLLASNKFTSDSVISIVMSWA